MFKKILSLLLISILVMSSIGAVSAKHYTYEIECTVGDNLKVLEMCYDLHVAVDMVFINTFRDSGLFRLHQKGYDPYYATAIKPGAVNLTMHYSCFDFSFYDDDYVHFIVKDKVEPEPNPVPIPENNSTPVNPDPVIPDVVPSVVPSISNDDVISNDSVGFVNNNIVNNSFMNITNVSNASNIAPIMGSSLLPKINNDHFIIKFLKDVYKSICKLLDDLYNFILNATIVIRGGL